MGVCAALFEAQRSGKGQVIDAAMTDGAASLMSVMYGLRAAGIWSDERDANLLDGGAHFYDVYEMRRRQVRRHRFARAAILRAAAGEDRA